MRLRLERDGRTPEIECVDGALVGWVLGVVNHAEPAGGFRRCAAGILRDGHDQRRAVIGVSVLRAGGPECHRTHKAGIPSASGAKGVLSEFRFVEERRKVAHA